jgi:hypothetical protein
MKTFLECGLIAGPLFTVAWIVEGATRANYDPLRHAISSLSVGDSGWIQIVTFIVTGLLIVAFAFGLRRALGHEGAAWGPVLIAFVGIGLIGSGIFVTDPLNGYPAGTPRIPMERTAHGIFHDLFGIPVFLGLPITCVLFGRLFARSGDRAWAVYSTLSGIAMFGVFLVARLGMREVPGFTGITGLFGLFQRITVTIGFTWLTLLAGHVLTIRSRNVSGRGQSASPP